jgi:hypothetical protein
MLRGPVFGLFLGPADFLELGGDTPLDGPAGLLADSSLLDATEAFLDPKRYQDRQDEPASAATETDHA